MISGLVIRGLVIAAVLGILTAGYFGWRGEQRAIGAKQQYAIDQLAADALKREAVAKLDAALKAKAEVEKKLRDAATAQGIKDAKNQTTVADLAGRLAALAAAGTGRLRDPNQASGCGDGGSSPPRTATAGAGAGAGDATQTGGLLSKPASELLLRLTAEADAVNLAYISCRASVMREGGG